MSVRQIRKLYGGNSLPPPEGNSDEEYEPLYAKSSPSKFKYQGLVLSSHSESEHESTDAVAMENACADTLSKKKKKKKKKQRKAKQTPKSSSKENLEALDEIDKSVMEVNALLGTPEPSASCSVEKPAEEPEVDLMAVSHKHINVHNEMKRLFGPEEPGQKRQRGRQPILNRLRRKAIIVQSNDPAQYQRVGLSMSILRRENECTYFIFEHNREYQKLHRSFLQLTNLRPGNLALTTENAQRNLHVEGMLESADSMFRFEAYSAANSLVEQAISVMQYVAHPSFNLTDRNVRLEYRYLENRPFHIAVLKYLHLLTNRACHRTALELAKMLLNLDPTDPLAVVFIIDTLALRAREHEWLIKAVAHWSKERDAGFLFNMQYSCALAHYHVATKKKGDVSEADKLLKEAMMRFPTVILNILRFSSATPTPQVQECFLFSSAEETTGKSMRELMALYAKFTWSKWREPGAFEWMSRNLTELADQIAADARMQERAKELSNERLNLYKGWPDEVIRHLCVIKPMAGLLVDGEVPTVQRVRSADPVAPSNGVSRYNYDTREPQLPLVYYSNSPLYELFSSVLPQYQLPTPRPQEVDHELAAAAQLQLELQGLEQLEQLGAVMGAEGVDSETLTDTDDSDSQEEVDEEGRERNVPSLVSTVNTLTHVFRRFVDAYEAGAGAEGLQPAAGAGAAAAAGADTPEPDAARASRARETDTPCPGASGDGTDTPDLDLSMGGIDTPELDRSESAAELPNFSRIASISYTPPGWEGNPGGPDTPDFTRYVVRDPVPFEDSDLDLDLIDDDDVDEYNMMYRGGD